ncbi:hypothetical protein GCM10027093_08990 [Paraburkholderia jirisanensis]
MDMLPTRGTARDDHHACAASVSAQLDQLLFPLDHVRFGAFMAALEHPLPARNAGLDRLMAVKAPWDQGAR